MGVRFAPCWTLWIQNAHLRSRSLAAPVLRERAMSRGRGYPDGGLRRLGMESEASLGLRQAGRRPVAGHRCRAPWRDAAVLSGVLQADGQPARHGLGLEADPLARRISRL